LFDNSDKFVAAFPHLIVYLYLYCVYLPTSDQKDL
jgi:hypothetical protein